MLTPDEIAQRRFLVALRGFDRDEVTEFLGEVGGQVRALRARVAELEAELAQARRSAGDDTPPDDPREAHRSLGEETARILVAAEESAEEIRARAKAAGRAELEEARREAREATDQSNRQAARTIAEAERRRDAVAAELASLRQERDGFRTRLREAVADVADVVGGLDDDAITGAAPDGGDDVSPPVEEAPADVTVTVAPVAPSQAPDDADARDPVVTRDVDVDDAVDRDGADDADVTDDVGAEARGHEDADTPSASTDAIADTDQRADPGEEAPPPGIAAVTASTRPPDEPTGLDDAPLAPPVEESAADPSVAARRDVALDSLRDAMSRRCKRGLQDVQNEVLAAIREHGAAAELTSLLPSESELEQLADLGAEQLEAAYRAALEDAVTAVDGEAPPAPGDDARVAAALATFRAVLTHEVTSALRATLRAGLEAREPGPQLSERVGEIFRDLRGPVLEGVVEEQLARTYGLGLLDTWKAMGVTGVQWEVGHEARCPENRCRTNAAEGALELGEDFPSGDRVPPAHPGCTCVVVPA